MSLMKEDVECRKPKDNLKAKGSFVRVPRPEI